MTTKTPVQHPPLFDQFTIVELAERTPYSEIYLIALKMQPHRITDRFRRTVALSLQRSEADLFGDQDGDAERPEYSPRRRHARKA